MAARKAAKKDHFVHMWAEGMVPELRKDQADALATAEKWQAQNGVAHSAHDTHKKLWGELAEFGLLEEHEHVSLKTIYLLTEAGGYVLKRMRDLGWL